MLSPFILTLQYQLCLIDGLDASMNVYPDLLTRIPLDYSGQVYRSPMPFSRFDPSQQVWSEYVAHGICDVFVLAESFELPRVFGVELLDFYQFHGLNAYHYPIPDFQIPADRKTLEVAIETLDSRARAGKNIAVHCLAGMGRTGLFLACFAKRHLDCGGLEAIRWIRSVIPGALENLLQENFVLDF